MSGTARDGASRREGSRGFTLIEMMVVILLLGVGMMGLAALTATVSRANVQSSELTTASTLAQTQIESSRAQPYASIVAGSDARTVNGVSYSRSWTVASDNPASGLKTIVVTVSWTSRGKTHNTTLSTIRGSL
jgi:prepilin-type N-terminal cleavage/methylation domain-containing protein